MAPAAARTQIVLRGQTVMNPYLLAALAKARSADLDRRHARPGYAPSGRTYRVGRLRRGRRRIVLRWPIGTPLGTGERA
jgi:hypothetical protein